MGGTGDDHDNRHRSNDSGQRAETAAQPEAGKLPDRGGLAGSRRRLEPPGSSLRLADDAAVEGVPGAVESWGTGIRWSGVWGRLTTEWWQLWHWAAPAHPGPGCRHRQSYQVSQTLPKRPASGGPAPGLGECLEGAGLFCVCPGRKTVS